MYEGRQIYFGPVESAAEYFYDLGFIKPTRATTADFLTSITNPAERILREDWKHRAPKSPDEFAVAWKNSPDFKRVMKDIGAFDAAHPLHEAKMERSHQSEKSSSIGMMLE